MFGNTRAFSSFSVDDLSKAKEFYGKTLGCEVTEDSTMHVLTIRIAGGTRIMVYPKGGAHTPATFTVLNFPVSTIEKAVDDLRDRGITFERYENLPADERGIFRGGGAPIAWFKDPAGNILSVVQENSP